MGFGLQVLGFRFQVLGFRFGVLSSGLPSKALLPNSLSPISSAFCLILTLLP
jgi:hypothetical protein